ncbi:MAG: hypothetical protein AAGF58_02965 [Pseudomonadota bacterium]
MQGHFFSGEHTIRLDSKGRIGIPVEWRGLLQGADRPSFNAHPCIKEKRLRCLSPDGLAKVKKQVDDLPTYDKRREAINALIISRAIPHNLDGQGRAVMDGALLKEVDIDQDMVLVGAGDHFEIWNPADLAEHRKELLDHLRSGADVGIEELFL